MEAPKSPWRYPHLMFRGDSRKHKTVSFKQSSGMDGHGRHGHHLELPPGAVGGHGRFGVEGKEAGASLRLDCGWQSWSSYFAGFLRRTDSKDSECSSLSSVPHQGRDDLRSALSVPMQDQFKKFRRTDSSESSNSSLASFGGLSAILNRTNSKKRARQQNAAALVAGHPGAPQVTLVGHSQVERADSGQSIVSRGYTVQDSAGSAGAATVVSPAAVPGSSVVTVSGASGKTDEVAIIVSGRKNSLTKAVRYVFKSFSWLAP